MGIFRCSSRSLKALREVRPSHHHPFNKRYLASLPSSVPQKLHVEKIAGSLGAVIHGVDVRTLDDSTASEMRQALLEHKVIFVRDQHLEPQEFLHFASAFGRPIEYPFLHGIGGFPEIIHVLKRDNEVSNFGGVWHCDTLYLEEPPMGTLLLAKQLPPYGGDTLFANQSAVYDALSEGMKKTLGPLTSVNTSAKADVSKTREDRVKESSNEQKPENLISRHPVIRTHPETGKKSIFVNTAHTERFEGWTEEESAPLLQFLFQHQIKPEFTCRFRWEPGSIAFWDNRAALHNPINDYHGFVRSMHRITLAGDKPR